GQSVVRQRLQIAHPARVVLLAQLLQETPGVDAGVVVAGKRDVNIAAIEPMGNYAVVLRFSDGHDTGIYTWSFLKELGEQHDARWARYLQALADNGLAREP
ncbi:MAG: gamma-butyrobetaine hydroxylase-like domain-containing protein, partial [Arenimonas sp.]